MARGHNLGKVINYKISSFACLVALTISASQPVVSKHFQSEEINHQAHGSKARGGDEAARGTRADTPRWTSGEASQKWKTFSHSFHQLQLRKKAEASRNCDRTELQMEEECQGEKVVDELFTRRQKRNFLKKYELGKRWHELLGEMVEFQFDEEDTRNKKCFWGGIFEKKCHGKKYYVPFNSNPNI